MGFLENFRISERCRWVPNRGAIGKIRIDKRMIQSEKSMRRSTFIEVSVDDSNRLMSFRTDRLDVRRP